VEFWLSRSLLHELFFFSQLNSGYHEAFYTNFTFSQWNFGYHEAFYTNFSFFHSGILAITKPFTLTFFYNRILAITKPFTRTFLFSHGGISAIMEPFTNFFSGGISAITEPFHGFLFHVMESRISGSLFTNFSFTQWNQQNARFEGRLFSYISQRVFT
jgi:hypothetical protein